jgi:hypothetical protein
MGANIARIVSHQSAGISSLAGYPVIGSGIIVAFWSYMISLGEGDKLVLKIFGVT